MEKIWETVADDVWACRVTRINESRGQLTVSRTDNPSTVILDEEVTLSFGGIFGPDMGDVAEWQEKCLGAIDAQ